jgi:hypothetical protein
MSRIQQSALCSDCIDRAIVFAKMAARVLHDQKNHEMEKRREEELFQERLRMTEEAARMGLA